MFIAKPFLPNLKRRWRVMWLLAFARSSLHPHMPPRYIREVGFCKRK